MKGSISDLMQQAQKMQADMQKAQEELARAEVQGEAGAGLVKVVMTGRHDVKRVSIDDAVFSEDKEVLEDLLAAQAAGKPPWKLLFDRLVDYFDERFGPDWKATHEPFWSDFSRTWEVGRGIQERLKHDKRILDKGI